MRAKDVMTTQVHTVWAETPVEEAAALMLDKRVSALPVVDDGGGVVGIVSEGDLLRRPDTGGERHRSWWLGLLADQEERAAEYVKTHGRHCGDVMTRALVTVGEDIEVSRIAELLEEHNIKRVPVMRDGRLVGIVSRADLLRALAARKGESPADAPADDKALRERIDKELKGQSWSTSSYVNIEVQGGVARLSGVAATASERHALRVLVENIPGVRGVEDKTTVYQPTSYA